MKTQDRDKSGTGSSPEAKTPERAFKPLQRQYLSPLALNSGSTLEASGKFWEQLYPALNRTN